MPESAYQAYVEVLPDFSDFNSIATRQMTSVLGAAGVSGGAAMNQGILGSVPKLAAPLLAAVAALGIGQMIGDVVGEGIRFGLEGIDLASDLQQSQGAVEAIFGQSSEAVTKFSTSAANDLGLAANAYNELASVLGAQLKNGGTSVDELAGKTNDLIVVGADLAATFGGTTADAVNALSSALRGERDPIENYGASLTQAAIDAKAAELGFTKVGGSLSTQANQAATLALIMDQTASSMGRAAAESDTLAGQQARLNAQYENAQTALGTALLPTMLLFTQLANDTLIPILNDLVEEVGPQLADALAESAPAFVELAEAIAPMLPDLIKLSVEAIPPLLSILTALAPILIDNALSAESFITSASALFGLISGDTSINEFVGALQGASGMLGTVYDAAMRAGAGIGVFIFDTKQNLAIAAALFGQLPGQIAAAFGNLGSLLYSSGRSLIQGFINGINDMLRPVGNAIGRLMSYVAGFFPHSPAERGPFSGAGWTAVADAGRALADQFSLGFQVEPAISFAGIGATSTVSQLRPSLSSGTAAVGGQGGTTFTGDIIVADPNEFVDVVEKRKRRANATAGLGTVLIA